MEFKEHLGVLSEIQLCLNTDGNIVVRLSGQNAQTIASIVDAEYDGATEYGYNLKKVIQRFEEHYHVINNAVTDILNT